MKSVRRPASIAATIAAIVLVLPAHAADSPGMAVGSGDAMARAVATTSAMTRLPSQRVAGNGGVHAVASAASAASRARNSRDVQTTIEDGRTVTRNAHEPHATDAAQTPND
jgi:hypothetical protein